MKKYQNNRSAGTYTATTPWCTRGTTTEAVVTQAYTPNET
jgi:hypothetical protein